MNAIQWGGLWFGVRMGGDVVCSYDDISLTQVLHLLHNVFVYLKAIYLVISSWITDISLSVILSSYVSSTRSNQP
jgi:hypothetical protein